MARAPTERLRKTRRLTSRSIGFNLVLESDQRARLAVCLEEGVPVVSTFWGDPGPSVEAVHAAGALHLHTVGSRAEAELAAAAAGVDVIVAQGVEAGGHVRGEVATSVLVPAVGEPVSPVPVIAATEDEIRLLTLFDGGWPHAKHRVVHNGTVAPWDAAGRPAPPLRPGEGQPVARSRATGTTSPSAGRPGTPGRSPSTPGRPSGSATRPCPRRSSWSGWSPKRASSSTASTPPPRSPVAP